MDKEKLKRLAGDPRFIPGIYSYCDRWCERCPFTSRCLTYAMCEEGRDDPAARDVENEAFWERLREIFRMTRELIEETAKDRGIDLESIYLEEAIEEERKISKFTGEHELALSARSYGKMAGGWLDAAQGLFEAKEEELNRELRLTLPSSDPQETADAIVDIVEVIRWYQHQIYVKARRALSGLVCGEDDDFPKDSDGSAKVALIGIDRSLAAWGVMLRHFPEEEDALLPLLARLESLRRGIEQAFPDARAFVRPGFDQPST